MRFKLFLVVVVVVLMFVVMGMSIDMKPGSSSFNCSAAMDKE